MIVIFLPLSGPENGLDAVTEPLCASRKSAVLESPMLPRPAEFRVILMFLTARPSGAESILGNADVAVRIQS